LDAQYFGLAQRRRRVFVVASAREGFNPSEVLFEFSGERRDTAPSRKTGQGITADAETGIKWPADLASTLNAAFGSKQGLEDQHALGGASLFVPAMCAEISPTVTNGPPFSCTGNERVECDALVTYGMQSTVIGRSETSGPQGMGSCEEVSYTLTKADQHGVVVAPPHAFKIRGGCEGGGKGYLGQDEQAFTITCGHDQQVAVANNAQYAVRRLTPIECERLQGFPDNYTNIPWRKKPEAPDGPRYKALGNSWAVPVVRWIGERVNFQILS
jgi:DNA (cytosine-5)-methyltransferase 1